MGYHINGVSGVSDFQKNSLIFLEFINVIFLSNNLLHFNIGLELSKYKLKAPILQG